MNKERKIPIYLSTFDWQAVMVCLLSHMEERQPSVGGTVWTIGRNRLRFIADEIAEKIKDGAADGQ